MHIHFAHYGVMNQTKFIIILKFYHDPCISLFDTALILAPMIHVNIIQWRFLVELYSINLRPEGEPANPFQTNGIPMEKCIWHQQSGVVLRVVGP